MPETDERLIMAGKIANPYKGLAIESLLDTYEKHSRQFDEEMKRYLPDAMEYSKNDGFRKKLYAIYHWLVSEESRLYYGFISFADMPYSGEDYSGELIPVEFDESENVITITIHCKLAKPTRELKQVHSMRRAVEQVFHKNISAAERRFESALLVYEHHYSGNARDTDNYDVKYLTDLVAERYMLCGDGPEHLQILSRAVKDSGTFTRITLIRDCEIENYLWNHLNLLHAGQCVPAAEKPSKPGKKPCRFLQPHFATRLGNLKNLVKKRM